MATKTLVIQNESFQFPVQGTSSVENWGEEVSKFAEKVTEVLGTVIAPNDLTLTISSLNDNQLSQANIIGLKFAITQVIFIQVVYIIERIVGATVYVESGEILGNYDGTDFYISTTTTGDAGVDIDVTPSGQFVYTSNALGHNSCIIKYKASTISN